MNILAAESAMTLGMGLGIGLVVALVLFGLIFLVCIWPALKKDKKANAADEANVEENKAEKEEEEAEKEEEEAIAVLEKEIEEEQSAEEPAKEEPVKEEPVAEEKAVEEKVVEEVKEEPEKPAPKAVKKETVAASAVEEEEDEEEEDDVEDLETEEQKQVRVAAIESAKELEVDQRYNRSYKARLIQSSDTIKTWYSAVKNAALSYKGVKSSVSWRQEKMLQGRTQVAKIALRGKTLCIYLPISVKDVKNIDVEDVSDKSVHAATPTLFRIKKEAHAQQAVQLIQKVAEKLALEEGKAHKTNYAKEYALESTDQLVEEGLIKVVTVKK